MSLLEKVNEWLKSWDMLPLREQGLLKLILEEIEEMERRLKKIEDRLGR